jgi:hypothetical protein
MPMCGCCENAARATTCGAPVGGVLSLPRMLPKSTGQSGLADGPKVSEVASKAAGGIRLQHGDMVNTRLALRSPAECTTFGDLTGSHCGLS